MKRSVVTYEMVIRQEVENSILASGGSYHITYLNNIVPLIGRLLTLSYWNIIDLHVTVRMKV